MLPKPKVTGAGNIHAAYYYQERRGMLPLPIVTGETICIGFIIIRRREGWILPIPIDTGGVYTWCLLLPGDEREGCCQYQ